jgi:hypothetical protein
MSYQEFSLPTYLWRTKTHKTIAGLHNAALKLYPRSALSFEEDAMVLCIGSRDNQRVIWFRRHLPARPGEPSRIDREPFGESRSRLLRPDGSPHAKAA